MGKGYPYLNRMYGNASMRQHEPLDKEAYLLPEVRIGRYVEAGSPGRGIESFHDYMDSLADLNSHRSHAFRVLDGEYFVDCVSAEDFTSIVVANNKQYSKKEELPARRMLYEHRRAKTEIASLMRRAASEDEQRASEKIAVLSEMDIDPEDECFYRSDDITAHMNWGERVAGLRSQPHKVGQTTLALCVQLDVGLKSAQDDVRWAIKTAGYGYGLQQTRPDSTPYIGVIELYKPLETMTEDELPEIPEPPRAVKLGPLILE